MKVYRNRNLEPKPTRRPDFRLATAIIALSAFGAGTLVGRGDVVAPIINNTVSPGCNIKGNISIDTGERIYHVPGQKYYSKTKISSQYGERWFCSEQEARTAGWRKSKV